MLLAGCAESAKDEPPSGSTRDRAGEWSTLDSGLPACVDKQPFRLGMCVLGGAGSELVESATGIVQAIERPTDDCWGYSIGRVPENSELGYVLVVGDEEGKVVARIGVVLPWTTPLVRVGDAVSVERTGSSEWMDSPKYGTMTLRGADGELLFWIAENAQDPDELALPELVVSEGETSCANKRWCGSSLRGIVATAGGDVVSIDVGALADVGDFVVLNSENTVSNPSCGGGPDNEVVGAVRGNRASLDALDQP